MPRELCLGFAKTGRVIGKTRSAGELGDRVVVGAGAEIPVVKL